MGAPFEVLQGLKRDFGYCPDETREKWVIFRDNSLIVVDPDRRPRIYRRGGNGVPVEIEPELGG